jgi:GNAT superfamily N-acetyltransferase
MRREEFPNLVRHTLEGVGMGGGYISWSRLSPENADAEIEHQVAHYEQHNLEVTWTVYTQDQPVDLAERLSAHGFAPQEPSALMVIALEDLDPSIWTLDISHVRKLATPEEVDEVVRLENEVWGEDLTKLGEGLKYDLVHLPEHVSIFTVWQAERVVSAGWSFYLMHTSFVSLFGGSTLKEFRGRGYYRSLLAARAREARERGFKHLYVEASPDSAPILARNGFRQLSTATDYEWKPA